MFSSVDFLFQFYQIEDNVLGIVVVCIPGSASSCWAECLPGPLAELISLSRDLLGVHVRDY